MEASHNMTRLVALIRETLIGGTKEYPLGDDEVWLYDQGHQHHLVVKDLAHLNTCLMGVYQGGNPTLEWLTQPFVSSAPDATNPQEDDATQVDADDDMAEPEEGDSTAQANTVSPQPADDTPPPLSLAEPEWRTLATDDSEEEVTRLVHQVTGANLVLFTMAQAKLNAEKVQSNLTRARNWLASSR